MQDLNDHKLRQEAAISKMESDLRQALDQESMKRIVIDMFNSRLVALEGHTTAIQVGQASILEGVREVSLQLKVNAPSDKVGLSAADKKLMVDRFASSLDES